VTATSSAASSCRTRLGDLELVDQVAHAQLLPAEELQDPPAQRLGQGLYVTVRRSSTSMIIDMDVR
jgi:hypothetical protein